VSQWESQEEFIQYFKNNFGISRYKLAKYFIEEILKQNFDIILFDNIVKIYSQRSFELYKQANFTKKLLSFLEFYKDKNLFVASGSNEEELKEIFKIREINKYFISIYGSPKKKSDIVKEIVKKYPNSIMIGDANSDMNAAKEVKIDFIFMRDYSTNEELKKRDDLVIINNLGDVIWVKL